MTTDEKHSLETAAPDSPDLPSVPSTPPPEESQEQPVAEKPVAEQQAADPPTAAQEALADPAAENTAADAAATPPEATAPAEPTATAATPADVSPQESEVPSAAESVSPAVVSGEDTAGASPVSGAESPAAAPEEQTPAAEQAPTAEQAPATVQAPAAEQTPAPAEAGGGAEVAAPSGPLAGSPESPAAADESSAPVQETVPAATAVEAGGQVQQTVAADAADAATAADGASTVSAGDRPSSRMRDKLGASHSEKPVGSEDILTQRPDIPTSVAPVDIPEDDDLDASLEAEISSAMGDQMSAPPKPVAPVTGEGDAGAGDAGTADQPAESAPAGEIGPGSTISGQVQHIHADDVFVNAGLRSDIVVSLKQFPEGKAPSVGDTLKVVIETVDDDGLFRARLPQARTKSGGNWEGLAVGQVVDCTVSGTNKGGLQVMVGNLKGFLPASQVDLGFVSDLEQFVGQKLSVQITEVKPRKKNLVVSRRVLLQAERESQQADFWNTLEVGQDHVGTVKTIRNYGAFVNLGPIDGFLHIGEISWSRINHPNEVLREGQEIQVRVLKIDKEKSRISLGMKQLVQNPWIGLSDRYPSERIVSGKVTRVADFGAFVELEPGVEGLVHISELAWRRVGSVGEVLKVGDEKEFKVLEVDQKRKRVSLSLKALEQRPESAARPGEPADEPRPARKANPDLRGGTGGNSGAGGLFGNPNDFS
ncbi:MAG: S1 RNA-binding domain-containing protein [Fuerstiella sp.]